MRVYDKNKKLLKVVCNQCGTAEKVTDGLVKKEFVSVKKVRGYFSEKDGQVHQLDLCESCYDRWISGFDIPVCSEEITEWI